MVSVWVQRFYRAMLCTQLDRSRFVYDHDPVSVRLSLTSRCSTKTSKRRITKQTPHDSTGNLVF